ncbi:MAG: hypothetical protein J5I90_07240 [Caldilineales bacterium]|nr:hypothetical protein [Caldilineales bacterium]
MPVLGAPAAERVLAPGTTIGGVNLGNLTNYLLVFTDGSSKANVQGATKGYYGNWAIDGVVANEVTSGSVGLAGTIYTNASTLGAWQDIVDDNDPPEVNPAEAFAALNETARISGLKSDLNGAFTAINALTSNPSAGFNGDPTSLDGLNTQNSVCTTYVLNVTTGFGISSQIDITGDACDVFVMRWDTDANFADGYEGQVKFQSGGAIVPHGGLKPSNFIHVAGDINASGGGSNPAAPYPQGPRSNDGTGTLCTNCADFSGGGFFTGYWLTTGSPDNPADANHSMPYGKTSSLSNAIFVGGWYSMTTEIQATSGTSGVYVSPNPNSEPTPTPTSTPTPTDTPTNTPTPTATPQSGSIGNYVWNDANGNGVQDEGTGYGLNAVKVDLYLDNGDGNCNIIDETFLVSEFTSGDGDYDFTNLGPGTYCVAPDANSIAAGYEFIAGLQSGPIPHKVELGLGEDYNDADFGYAARGNITGIVFWDWNRNGVQDLGEDGIPDVEVCLYKDANHNSQYDDGIDTLVSCQLSGNDPGSAGFYNFQNQLPGDYIVVQDSIPGLDTTTGLVRALTLIVIGASGSNNDNDFGNITYGSIGDFIYLDSNGNGTQDGGEFTGIPGVPITLTNLSTLAISTTVSSSEGSYVFDNLLPGSYTVETPSSVSGVARTSLSPLNVTLGIGQDYIDADFGYIAPTAVALASFTADAVGEGVLLRWATVFEEHQEGFRVWRAIAYGQPKPVSPIIPAANDPNGGVYEWLDVGATGTEFWYQLESLPDGEMFGPIPVREDPGAGGSHPIYIPFVMR